MDRTKRYLLIATCSLLIYMPFHIFLSQWLSTATGGLDGWKIGKDVFTAALFSVVVGVVLAKKLYTKNFLILLGLSLSYTALHLLLLKTTDQPYETGLLATVYNSRLFWYLLIGYGLALILGHSSQLTVNRFFKILIAVSTAVCLLGLAQWYLPADTMAHFGYSVERGARPAFFIDDKSDLPRLFSTIRDPNSLGAFLILPITILSWGLVRFWKTNKRQLLIGLLMLHSLILLLTFSRSGLFGAIIAVALMLVLTNPKTTKNLARKFWLPAVVSLLIIAGILFNLRDQYFVQNAIFHSDEDTIAQQDSNEKHISLARQGVNGVLDQPSGHGPGTAGLVAIQRGGILTENYYLQIANEVGIAGLAIFIATVAIVFRGLWQRREDYPAAILVSAFVALSLINLLLHTWSNEAVAISWFLLAGLILKNGDFRRSKVDKKPVGV